MPTNISQNNYSLAGEQVQTIFDAAQPVSEEYENKIKEYNSNTAKIIRFIGRLTPYLY